jgi:5-methylcytosine-specific restriction endonuclease McrA
VPAVQADVRAARRERAGDVLDLPVLLLNRHFNPVTVTSARRAFVLLYGAAAEALDEGGDTYDFTRWARLPVRHVDDGLPTLHGELRVPRVLHLLRYERTPRLAVRLTRKNLMLRDQHQCQYCARRLAARDLNVDHVQPRSRGGADSWENLVTSCRVCNLRKGHRTPEEAGMRLLAEPRRPRWTTAAHILLNLPEPFEEWQPYLAAG